ncbi:hypothetical protein QUA54_16195 [Microcoleus sp. MOSTC5]|uniref:hypothetical protein n=1 Tax=Microcoleus sp. MOSTC5 TaxID=3055378 RepID=UPI002FCF7B45
MSQLHVIGTTFFKKTTVQSSRLPANEKVAVNAGETLKYNPDSLKVVGEHYLVELLEQIAPWGTTGYFYSPHIQLEVSGFANRLVRKVLSNNEYWDILRTAEQIRNGTDNTCVAFSSETLRRMGIPVPIEDVEIDGEILNISLVTKPYKIWLEQKVKPRRINDATKLRPGDICFSKDDPDFPGFPAHVYFFIEYSPGDTGAAYVVDNQQPKHLRNLDNGSPGKTPFAFALRLENQFEEVYAARELVEKSFLEASETLRQQLMLNQAFE